MCSSNSWLWNKIISTTEFIPPGLESPKKSLFPLQGIGNANIWAWNLTEPRSSLLKKKKKGLNRVSRWNVPLRLSHQTPDYWHHKLNCRLVRSLLKQNRDKVGKAHGNDGSEGSVSAWVYEYGSSFARSFACSSFTTLSVTSASPTKLMAKWSLSLGVGFPTTTVLNCWDGTLTRKSLEALSTSAHIWTNSWFLYKRKTKEGDW